jgi:hypothetical protein
MLANTFSSLDFVRGEADDKLRASVRDFAAKDEGKEGTSCRRV